MSKLGYIIRSRIRDYEYDIECVEKMEPIFQQHEQQRLIQDKLIIQELNKILTGKGLDRLSYEN